MHFVWWHCFKWGRNGRPSGRASRKPDGWAQLNTSVVKVTGKGTCTQVSSEGCSCFRDGRPGPVDVHRFTNVHRELSCHYLASVSTSCYSSSRSGGGMPNTEFFTKERSTSKSSGTSVVLCTFIVPSLSRENRFTKCTRRRGSSW